MTTSIQQLHDTMTSDSDDESFVVLSSSLPQESLLEIRKEDLDSIDHEPLRQSLDSANEALEELSKNGSDKLPSLPKVGELSGITSGFLPPDTTTSLKSNVSDLSESEIQKKVDILIEENAKLKDALVQNHLALKKQYDTIAMWNEDVQKVHEIHKQKFAETKAYVDKLKIENAKLKESLQVAESTISCLQDELGSLKGKDSYIKQLNHDLYKSTFDNLNKFELEAAQKKIIDLEEQLSKMHLSANASEADLLKTELHKLKEEKEKLSQELINEQKQSVMKQSKLIEEIDGLRGNLTVQLNNEKEIIVNLRQQLSASQMQLTQMSEENRKIKEQLQIKENELSDYKQGLQSLQARVVDPVVMQEKNRRIEELEKSIQELKAEIEMVPILKEQLEIYRTDFEAEREAKDALKSQKESLAEDLGNLQRRNQQLLEEVERLRNATGNNPEVGRARPVELPGAPQELYSCPRCNFRFSNLQALENHVYRCIELDSLP